MAGLTFQLCACVSPSVPPFLLPRHGNLSTSSIFSPGADTHQLCLCDFNLQAYLHTYASKAFILSLMFSILCDIRVRSSVTSRSSKHVIKNNWILRLLAKTVLSTQSRVIRNSKRDNRQPCLFQSSCSKVRSTVPH